MEISDKDLDKYNYRFNNPHSKYSMFLKRQFWKHDNEKNIFKRYIRYRINQLLGAYSKQLNIYADDEKKGKKVPDNEFSFGYVFGMNLSGRLMADLLARFYFRPVAFIMFMIWLYRIIKSI